MPNQEPNPKPQDVEELTDEGLDETTCSPAYDTPETDKWIASHVGLHTALADAIAQMKKLERERNEARKEAESARRMSRVCPAHPNHYFSWENSELSNP